MKTDSKKLISAAIIFALLAGGGAATVIAPKQDFSENQNRYLAKLPVFSPKKLFSGDYTDGLETYLADHFIFHDALISAKNGTELAVGQDEINGIYITEDRLIEKIAEPDPEVTKNSIDCINSFAEVFGKPVFFMLIPTQAEIYRDKLPKNAPNPDQKEYIDNVTGQLNGVAAIDVYTPLAARSSEYIYYRTDHHWTTRGAYTAYRAASRRMGYEYLTEESFDRYHCTDSFRGTFYSKVLLDTAKPDTIDIYLPTDSERRREVTLEIYSDITAEPEIHEGMYFYDHLEKKDKYSVFFGTNQPMIKMTTGAKGGRLLILKDSYAHCMVPFLAEHYSEITMLDTRYIQVPINRLIDPTEYDQALLCYNVSTFMDGVRFRIAAEE